MNRNVSDDLPSTRIDDAPAAPMSLPTAQPTVELVLTIASSEPRDTMPIMRTIEGETLRKTIVHLDNTMYRNCVIEHCQVVYSGGPPGGFDGCTVANNQFVLAGPALATARFMASMHAIPEMKHIVEGWIRDITAGPQSPTSQLTH